MTNRTRRGFLMGTAAIGYATLLPMKLSAAETVVKIATPMAPPEWALLEREVLRAHTAACIKFYKRYFNPANGWLEIIERWGGNDGPDDAIEYLNDWPHVYAMGGDEVLRDMYEKAYEGHVRQFTAAKTTDVPFAKGGMYYKEWPTQMDWQHNGEGLTVFAQMPLGNPYDRRYRERIKRFAGFYMDEDPGAPNYDPKLKLIRSMMNGSKGPMLRKATALDWAGDPIDLAHRFPVLAHGEADYQGFLDHFKDYNDVVGDNPLNLVATSLAATCYMLTHEAKYKTWIVEYTDAWIERARANNDIIPSNVGRDGKIGGDADGKWYGGVYGWSFSPIVPQTGKRADRNRLPRSFVGFMNAYLVTKGDDKYLDVWRRQADKIDAQAKVIDGKKSSPTMHGDQGWYGYRPGNYQFNFLESYYLSMRPSDRARCEETGWYSYLEGKNPTYPVKTLRDTLGEIRKLMEQVDADTSAADMRLADAALHFNPGSPVCSVLTQLMEAGLYIGHPGWAPTTPGQGGALQFSRLRYFDPERRRAGVPEDVAVLADSWSADHVAVTIVNLNQTAFKSVIVQGGAYAEHQLLSVSDGKTTTQINATSFPLRLAPGAGARLTIRMKRFANDPTLSFPWEATVADVGEIPNPAPEH